MDIYSIKELLLQAKPVSEHYLERYVKLIVHAIEHPTKEKKYDRHHILPKSMFPEYKSFKENPWNKIKLSKRQHFIAHHLLWKAFRNQQMACAFWYMSNIEENGVFRKIHSREYDALRKEVSEKMSGKGNPMYGRKCPETSARMKGENNPMYGKPSWCRGKKIPQNSGDNHPRPMLGKPTSKETKEKISNRLKGVKKSPEHTENIRKSRIGAKFEEASIHKMKQWHSNKIWISNYDLKRETQIQKDFLTEYESKGWIKGRLKVK